MNEGNAAPHLGATEQWPEVSRLLDEALTLPERERGAWLASLPATPAKAALQHLLEQHARIESANFLGTLPRLSPAALAHLESGDVTHTLRPGDEIGPWRLLRALGRGGMGAVWLAERADGGLKRQVALKMPNRTWDAALAERMLRERDILASLTHPHIARLYDAGFDSQGRPFLALEHVDGKPIQVYVHEHLRANGTDARRNVQAILALLQQVCAAVAHAHSRLVIHRDLKPSNILVDAHGQVRLLDFGIAKLMEGAGERTEDTALTRAAGHVLTLEYASPEQVRGDPLTTASDVYSMGVIAYELLAGGRPYRLKRGTPAELEEAIALADPPRASEAASDPAMRKALRGDLDAILNKALKKRPDERYATITALAEDLQRHLDGHAVSARPDSRWYVARKFVARHRVPVLAAVGVVAALGVGLGGALWQTAVARENLRRATMALEREDGVRRLFVEALASVAALDPKAFAESGSVSRTLQSKLAELEQLFRDQPYQRLSLLNAVAIQLPYFGDYEGSLSAWRRYLVLVKAERGDAQQLLEGYIGATRALYFLQRFRELEEMARDGLTVTSSAVGVAGTRAELAYQLVQALVQRGARTEARTLIDEHARLVEASDDRGHKVRWDLLLALARMERDYDDVASLKWSTQARAGYATNADSSVSQHGMSALYVGLAHGALGQLEPAEVALKVCLQLYDNLFGRVDRDSVTALGHVAHVVAARGNHDEARRMLDERMRTVEATPGPDTALALRTLQTRQVEVALLLGDLQGASRMIEPMRASHAQLTNEVARGPAVINEARWHQLAGRPQAAATLLSAWVAKLPPERALEPQPIRARLLRAEAEMALGHLEPARRLLDDVTRDLRRIGATRNWGYRFALELTAVAGATGASSGQAAEAWATLEQAEREAGVAALEPPSAVERAESVRRRAGVLRAAGRAADAATLEASLREALTGQHAASPRRAWLTNQP